MVFRVLLTIFSSLLEPTTGVGQAAFAANFFLVAAGPVGAHGIGGDAQFFSHLRQQGAYVGAEGVCEDVVRS